MFFSWLCGFFLFDALWVPSWWCSLVLGVVCGCSVLALISSAFFGCGFRQFIIFGVWSIMSSDKLEEFPIRFTGKDYSAWEFQFKLFVKGKELWGHIDGIVPAPQGAEALSKWEIHDARVMTWLLSSVESHLVLNLTVAAMWTYLNTVYNQDNSTKRFHLEYEMANFTQGSLSIEEYFLVFKLFRLTIATLFMLMFPLQLSLLSEKCMPPASEINS